MQICICMSMWRGDDIAIAQLYMTISTCQFVKLETDQWF